MIASDSIEGLKAQLDIVDVIGNYIELKRAGTNYKAVCPFHDEKTPSFVVSPSKQIYHCFGCGAGGDSIKFVMDYEHLSYPEAIEKLAREYNYTLRYEKSDNKKKNLDLLKSLSEFYEQNLLKNKVALDYLKKRGVYESSIEKFELGFAGSSFETIEFLKKNFFDTKEAIELGVLGFDRERNNLYARFIDRIMFPIYSQNGLLVGFGGRTITNHPAKYINSPETSYFNKSKLLYGFYLAKDTIYKKKEVIITEGYLDVIMLHQAGFSNAVATLGTALTRQHLPLLRKTEAKVILSYDGDSAGINAALKASILLSHSGFEGGVVIFEGDMDPADMVYNGKIDKLNDKFKNYKPFIEFVIDMSISKYDIKNPFEKEKVLNELKSYLLGLSEVVREEYKVYVASKLGISPSIVNLKQTSKQEQINKKTTYKDMAELTIIKTILEHPKFLDTVLNLLDERVFVYHKDEFRLVLENQTNDKRVIEILLDDSIKTINDIDELKGELKLFLIKHFERELKTINMKKNITFKEKSFYIRKIRDKILRLKKGELVGYD